MRSRAEKLFAGGLSIREVARRTGYSRTTITCEPAGTRAEAMTRLTELYRNGPIQPIHPEDH
jgi:transposase